MRPPAKLLWLMVVLSLVTLQAAAQVQYGTISGAVTDSERAGLPGVTVTLSGPFMQGAKTTVTDQDGRYRLVPVPPGERYLLRFELYGFAVLEQSALMVNAGRDTRLDAELAPSQFAEAITVSAERLVVDTAKSTVDTVVTWDLADTLSTTRHYNTIWYMTPGVPVLGVGSGEGQNNPSVHGGGGDDNAILIDGVDTTDPLSQTWGAQLNWDTIQEAQVQTAGFAAEFGRATGGVLNLITRSGGNESHVTARGVWRDSEWAEDPGYDEERGVEKASLTAENEFRPSVTLGGPILKDRLWFYLGYERRDRDRTYHHYASYDDLLADTLTPYVTGYEGHFASAKLTLQAADNHSLVAYYNEDRIDEPNRGCALCAASTFWTRLGGGFGASLQWYGVFSPDLFLDAKYQIVRGYLDNRPQAGGFGETPTFADRNTGYVSGAAQGSSDSDRDRDGLLLAASYFVDTQSGGHQLKAGLEYLRIDPQSGGINNPAGWYLTRGTAPNSRYLYLDQVQTFPTDDSYWALFVQDAWTLGRLTLNLGIRAERYTGATNTGVEVVDFGFGDQVAPRLGFAWDLNGDSLHGSLGRFYDLPTNAISGSMSENPTRLQYWRWNGSCPAEGQWWQTPDECWTLQWDVPYYAGGWEVDPGLKPIYVDEVTVGYDHRLSDRFAVGATYVWREQKRSIDDIDPDYDGVRLWTNGPLKQVEVADGRVFETDHPWKEYRSFSLTLNKRAGPEGLQFLASYTYVIRSKGWWSTGGTTSSTPYSQWTYYCDDPDNCDPLWYGDLQSPHTLKFFGSWTAPWRMVVGLSAWWTSGNLYGRLVPGEFSEVPLEPYGSSEVGDNWEADLHVEQPFRLGPVEIAVYADAYNVFNNQQPTRRGENAASPTEYMLPTVWQAPRQYAVGLKIEY